MKFVRGSVSIILFIVLLFIGSTEIFAASPIDKKDVDPHHDFTVYFNQKVDQKTVHIKNIHVIDQNGKIVTDKEPKVVDGGYKVVVEAPESGYAYGSTYRLVVTDNVLSEKQKPLTNELQMNFTIKNATANSDASNHHTKTVASLTATADSSLNPLKEQIRTAFQNRQTSFSIKYYGDLNNLTDKITKTVEEVLSEDEYLFYDYRNYRFTWNGKGNEATINFTATFYQTKEQVDYVNKRVQEILAKIIKSSMNDHEKVKAVHDYVVSNVAYDTTYSQANNAPYFALTKGKTLCNGYAMLVYKMLEELDIPVRLISGKAGGDSHAWNLVQLDGKWYHLDVTWDDPTPDKKGQVTYDYYLLADDEIRQSHSWKDGGSTGIEKTYPRANTYYIEVLTKRGDKKLMESLGLQYLTSDYTVDDNKFSTYLKTKISKKEKNFTFRYVTNKPNVLNNFKQIISAATNGLKYKNLNWNVSEIQRTKEKDYLVSITVTY